MTLPTLHTLSLFCRVVDNYGDIGICWRMARQLHHEHALQVTLWVDDLLSFKKLCPTINPDCAEQEQSGIRIRRWDAESHAHPEMEVSDLVIEFFGCDLPPDSILAMSQRTPRPVWINYEGLSAEEWVEGCHTLPSPHPQLPLTKYFFFPGFTARTGGLLGESSLPAARTRFIGNRHAQKRFAHLLGLTPAEQHALKISLFCYPEAPLPALLRSWEAHTQAICCLVPQGVACAAIEAWLGHPATPGSSKTRGALTLRIIPFLPQEQYDLLLWYCDLNFVRGEDSFVRAQWAGKPFIWHIYPQDKNLHHKKLRAFLDLAAPPPALHAFSLAWNAASDTAPNALWTTLMNERPALDAHALAWAQGLNAQGDAMHNLMHFAHTIARRNAADHP